MKIALFRNPNCENPVPGDEFTEKFGGSVRVTEWVDVEFPSLSAEARDAQLAKFQAARELARQDFEFQLARINKQAEALQS